LRIELRNLTHESDRRKISDLFLDRYEMKKDSIVRDRLGNPYGLWNLLGGSSEARYLGIFKNQELVACSAQIKHCGSSELQGFQGHLETDLFISPRHRHSISLRYLFTEKFKAATEVDHHNHFYWGIEHLPQSLNVCARVAAQFNCRMDFPIESILYQIPTYGQKQGPELDEYQVKKLSDLSPEQLKKIQTQLNNRQESAFELPQLSPAFVINLCRQEPESWIASTHDLSSGVLLTSFRSLRRWVATGKPSLEFERLRRSRHHNSMNGTEIKFLMLGSPWGLAHDLDSLIRKSIRFACDAGFDYLVFRDLPSPQELKDVFEFRRRIFFFSSIHSDFSNYLESLKKRCRIGTFFV
jgi:hypothetical protein